MRTASLTRRGVRVPCACGCGRLTGGDSRSARGLSGPCYKRLHARDPELVLNYPRALRSVHDVAEDWPYIDRSSLDVAAAALSMTPAALDKALRRAVDLGLLARDESRPWWDFDRGCRRRHH